MKRVKRHKVKSEAPETSTSHNREQEIHDLAYYIHDRVELMHQVFSVIKYKELKAMVPASIRNISLNDLQELCTEELLGISSKRLCAILDGAEPPSDTDSSSPSPPPEQMETISLDSISSDDEILSQTSNKKKKHKHRRHSKSKAKRKKSKDADEDDAEQNKATRAGLTVLELLELQARARAIRAQLQQEQQKKPVSETASKEPPHSSDNEVEIKEEPPEVVEISSDEEKPKIEELQKQILEEKEGTAPQQTSPPTVTKRINDLVITVPQKTKQKIKLNRNKSIPATTDKDKPTSIATIQKTTDTPDVATAKIIKPTENKIVDSKNTKKDKSKKKKKDKKNVSKDDIDNDEITLQLSDTEKMDLLEDLDRKHYDSVSSESSSDSSSDSDVSAKEKDNKDSGLKEDDNVTTVKDKDCEGNAVKVPLESEKGPLRAETVARQAEKESEDSNKQKEEDFKASSELVTEDITKNTESSNMIITDESEKARTESDKTVQNNTNTEIIEINLGTQSEIVEKTDSNTTSKDTVAENSDATIKDIPAVATKDIDNEEVKDSDKNLSDGELSDRESSEVEAVDLKPEVVCISDEEGGKKAKKKKKKKEKKSKKDKKSKKKSDFRESADQNFYKDNLEMENSSQGEKETQVCIEVIDNTTQSDAPLKNSFITKTIDEVSTEIIEKVDLTTEKTRDNDIKPIKEELPTDKDVKTHEESPAALSDSDIEAVFEIMELSDDSSCCEVECTTKLSKEPTASEIEALSAKIDEIERVEIITDKEIRDYQREQEKRDIDNIEHVSWKDRYLDSTKVKKVLTTANILNALRKKNIELKKKLAESKMDTEETVPEEKEVQEDNVLEEGSIEHYNTLEALTTYVDPVKEVSKDLKKDAKLLLKMYKKLLKYNDINKPEDPNKRKKKKKKKIKKDTINREERKSAEVGVENIVSMENKDASVNVGEELGIKEHELNSIELVSKEKD